MLQLMHLFTLLVRLLMAHRMRRMSVACHMSSPNTALHLRTMSPTCVRRQAAGSTALSTCSAVANNGQMAVAVPCFTHLYQVAVGSR